MDHEMLFMDSCTKIAIFFIKSKQFIAKGEISKIVRILCLKLHKIS